MGEMEVDLQKRERIFEDYQDEAKQILRRIEQLEKEYQEVIFLSVIVNWGNMSKQWIKEELFAREWYFSV